MRYAMVWDVVAGGRGMVIGKTMLPRELVEAFGCDSDLMDWEPMPRAKLEALAA
jgi:hypothetical protein